MPASIRAAFETRLAAWAASQTPPIPVAYENVGFTPPTGRYARCHVMPSPTESETFNGEHRRYMGIFQVSLYMPAGAGSGASAALAASLDATFPMRQPMTQGGVKIFLLSPMSEGPAIQDADRYVVPVSCAYRADVVV